MSDLISRAALFNALATAQDKGEIFSAIQSAPAVDAVPDAHAYWRRPISVWNKTSSYRYECSACGKIAHQVTGNCGRKIKQSNPKCTYSYCPSCGAKMDEEVNH